MISIISPVKNAEKYLVKCLDSIINQSFENWELLMVNDHSDDKTWDILKQYAQSDSRIKPLNSEGVGIIPALQLGYKKSKGEYITRMDADDVMPRRKLELMRSRLKSEPNNGVVTGKVTYFCDEKELGNGFINYQNWLNSLVDSGTHFKEIYKECVIASPCWMIDRKTFDQCGGFNSAIYPEDYDLVFRWYQHQIPVFAIDEVLHFWRDHPNRASRNSEHYADNSFIGLKMNYFIMLDYEPQKTLLLWGAGKRGKIIAQALQQRNITFVWACDNPKKIGKKIYEVLMEDVDTVFQRDIEFQSIVSVANSEAQSTIKEFLKNKQNVQPFMFC